MSYNGHEGLLRVKSSTNSSLELDEENEDLGSMAEVAARGGGRFAMRARGVSREITTDTSVITENIEELDVESTGAQTFLDATRPFLNIEWLNQRINGERDEDD